MMCCVSMLIFLYLGSPVTASEYGIAYSNSVRIGPRLRLFSVIVALESAMRTLALFPLLLAISPSRIRIRRVTKPFQSSFASKNLRSISVGMRFSASQVSNLEPVGRRRSVQHARWTRLGADLVKANETKKTFCPDTHRSIHGTPACAMGT